MPTPHPRSFTAQEFTTLVDGIDPRKAAVAWACRSIPLPHDCRENLDAWAFFVEVGDGIWVMFDDLPKKLADVLLEERPYELIIRALQRPFSEEKLAELVGEIEQMELSAEAVHWSYADFNDPYCLGNVPRVQVGREYFVRAPSGPWVWLRDLPRHLHERVRKALEAREAAMDDDLPWD
jgi:hypothetical protein